MVYVKEMLYMNGWMQVMVLDIVQEPCMESDEPFMHDTHAGGECKYEIFDRRDKCVSITSCGCYIFNCFHNTKAMEGSSNRFKSQDAICNVADERGDLP